MLAMQLLHQSGRCSCCGQWTSVDLDIHLGCTALVRFPSDMGQAEEVEKAVKKVRDDRLRAEQERRDLLQRGSREAKMKTQLALATKRAKNAEGFR